MALKVTRTRFSRFELGIGDLPPAAKNLLTKILHHMRDPETASGQHPEIMEQRLKKDALLLHLQKENQYQLENFRRKVARMETSYNNSIRTLQVVEFLRQQTNGDALIDPDVLSLISNKTAKILKEQSLAEVYRLKLKLELLELEKLLLEAEIRKSSKIPAFIDSKE